MPVESEFDPDVFHGELTANRAQVFVRAARPADWTDCTLHGFVHGPRCELAHTLPAKFVLKDLGAGPTLLARATLTDPCLWTGDLPQIYDVHIELRRGSEVVAHEQRMIGLRGIGTRVSGETSQLVREAKPWVPRGVGLELLEAVEVNSLREQLLVGVCDSPPLDLLVEASRRGLYLIVRLDAERQDVPTALRSLARWPAVVIVVICGGGTLDPRLNQIAPNLLLTQAVRSPDMKSFEPASWAAGIWWEVPSKDSLAESVSGKPGPGQLPVFIQASPGCRSIDPARARQECDRLQGRLALIGQLAGYFIATAADCFAD